MIIDQFDIITEPEAHIHRVVVKTINANEILKSVREKESNFLKERLMDKAYFGL